MFTRGFCVIMLPCPNVNIISGMISVGIPACDGFQCSNGDCVPAARECDSYNDCGDWSDELNCSKYLGFNDFMVLIMGFIQLVCLC